MSREPSVPAKSTSTTRPKKTAIILAQQIVHDIVNRRLRPGAMLPPEHEMLAELGVGRATMREALRYLELQGILIIRAGPRGGPMVAEPSSRQLASTLALLLEMAETPQSDILAARLTLEPMLTAQAASRIDARGLRDLQHLCDAMFESLDRKDLFADYHHRFHDLVAQHAGIHVVHLVLSSLHWITEGTPAGLEYPIDERKAIAEAHQTIVDAMRARDPQAAEAAMLQHILDWEAFVSKRYPDAMKERVHWGDRFI